MCSFLYAPTKPYVGGWPGDFYPWHNGRVMPNMSEGRRSSMQKTQLHTRLGFLLCSGVAGSITVLERWRGESAPRLYAKLYGSELTNINKKPSARTPSCEGLSIFKFRVPVNATPYRNTTLLSLPLMRKAIQSATQILVRTARVVSTPICTSFGVFLHTATRFCVRCICLSSGRSLATELW